MTSYIIKTHDVTPNRACRLMRLSRSVLAYQAQKNDDSVIKSKLQELTTKHIRYEFRKVFHKLRALGFTWNHKRVYRVYCALKLNLKHKPKK